VRNMGFLDKKQMEMILEHYCNFDELQYRSEDGQRTYKGSFFGKQNDRDVEVFRFKIVDNGKMVLLFYVPFDGNTYQGESLKKQIDDEICFPEELLIICSTDISDYTRKNSYQLYVYGWAIREQVEDLDNWLNSMVWSYTLEEIFRF